MHIRERESEFVLAVCDADFSVLLWQGLINDGYRPIMHLDCFINCCLPVCVEYRSLPPRVLYILARSVRLCAAATTSLCESVARLLQTRISRLSANF